MKALCGELLTFNFNIDSTVESAAFGQSLYRRGDGWLKAGPDWPVIRGIRSFLWT